MGINLRLFEQVIEHHPELDKLAQPLQQFLQEYRDYKIFVAMLGEFSVGKSALLNAFLGEDLLEVDTQPTTDRPYEIRYAPRRSRREEDGIVYMELDLPRLSPFPELVLVDLPGVTSQFFDHYQVVRRYLKDRHAVFILCVDATKGGITAEIFRIFLEFMKEHGIEYALLLTKTDLLPPEELDRVKAQVLRILEESYKAPGSMATVSVADNQIAGFLALLEYFYARRDSWKERVFLGRYRARLESSLEVLQEYLLLLENSLKLTTSELESRMKKVVKAKEDVERITETHIDLLKRKVETVVSDFLGRVEGQVWSHYDRLVQMPHRAKALIEQIVKGATPELLETLGRIVESTSRTLKDELDRLVVSLLPQDLVQSSHTREEDGKALAPLSSKEGGTASSSPPIVYAAELAPTSMEVSRPPVDADLQASSREHSSFWDSMVFYAMQSNPYLLEGLLVVKLAQDFLPHIVRFFKDMRNKEELNQLIRAELDRVGDTLRNWITIELEDYCYRISGEKLWRIEALEDNIQEMERNRSLKESELDRKIQLVKQDIQALTAEIKAFPQA